MYLCFSNLTFLVYLFYFYLWISHIFKYIDIDIFLISTFLMVNFSLIKKTATSFNSFFTCKQWKLRLWRVEWFLLLLHHRYCIFTFDCFRRLLLFEIDISNSLIRKFAAFFIYLNSLKRMLQTMNALFK
jgi:uncharacterized RDD family membrane protein YckC